jgi:hypothetical protein
MPANSAISAFDPPWPGGSLRARRWSSVPQSIVASSTVRPHVRIISIATWVRVTLLTMLTGSRNTTVSPL